MIEAVERIAAVKPYNPSWRATWDDFVCKSRNGTFLFERAYMDYHAHRFVDCSLMVGEGDEIAILPAHRIGDTLYSHNGLTYGGFIFDGGMTLRHMLDVFDAALCYLQSVGVRRWLYKTVPFIYHKAPSDEPLVALYLLDAPIVRTCALSVMMPDDVGNYEARRLRGIAKAQRCHLYVAGSTDWARMWEMLLEVLPGDPTHTLTEIRLLAGRFPQNIKLWGAYEGDTMVAGVVIYETDKVARAQYIATSSYGKMIGAGDLLMSYLLEIYGNQGKAVDLGTSDSGDGRELSRGILDYKEGWGARTVAYSHYMIDVEHYEPGALPRAIVSFGKDQ